MYGMVIAKKVILMLWRSDTVPLFKNWLTELISVLHMGRVRYGMMDSLNKFTDYGSHFWITEGSTQYWI